MCAAQTTATAGPLIGSPRASIDLEPYVSQLRTWLDSANEVHVAEQMKQIVQAILRMIARLIARVCHLFGIAYYGLRQGIRGEVMELKNVEGKVDEPVAAVVDRGALTGAAFGEALAAVETQIKHLVKHIVSGDANRAGDYADPDKLDAILQDFARSRQDFGHLANQAKADVDRLLPQAIALFKAVGGNADPKAVMAVLSQGVDDPQARLIDQDGHLLQAIADHAQSQGKVRNMEMAAHALVVQAGHEGGPAVQARVRARALELMPGALEFLTQQEGGPEEPDGEVASAHGKDLHETPGAAGSDAYILAARNEHQAGSGDVSSKIDNGAKAISSVKGGFARFAKQVDASGFSEVGLPDESVFDAPVPPRQLRETARL
jgi:hypothetical protein